MSTPVQLRSTPTTLRSTQDASVSFVHRHHSGGLVDARFVQR